MSLTLKEAIQARKLKLIATELEPLARKDRTVKKIVDTLKKGKEPNPDDINSLKGDTQDDVVMAFASVIGPSQTSKFLGEAKTIKVGEDAVGAKQPHYVIVKDRKVIAKGNKEEMMEKCGDGERVWLSTKDVGDIVEEENPCWDGYKKVGMKKNKKGKKVPNCVPEGKEDPDIGDRKGSQPAVYHKGLSKSTKEKRDAQFKKQAKMDDDNPAAYKPAPGDKEAKTKESKYTKKYKEMFGESTTKTALQKKSEDSGIAYGILKDVYDRGVAAWRTGHRPGTTPAQWGMARVNSFITGGKTRTTADKDLWQKHKGKKEEFEMSDNELVEMKVGDTVRIKDKPKNVVDKKMFGKSGVVMGKMGRDFRVKLANGRSLMVDPKDLEMVNEGAELNERVSRREFAKLQGTFKDSVSKNVVEFDENGMGFVVEDKRGNIHEFEYKNMNVLNENIEDRMPASPDEKRMAMKQAEFIQYVGREIGEHLVANKEFPEWMQNKLSALHQKAKDMHATLGAHGETFEEVELEEAKTIKISFRSSAAKNKWMKKQSITPKEVISQSPTMVELPASMKQYAQKKDHEEIYQVKESVELSEAGAKLKKGDFFDHAIVVNGVSLTLARRGKGMSVPYVVYLDGKEWKTFKNRKTALKAGVEHAKTKDGTFKAKFTDAKSLNRWIKKTRVYDYVSYDKKNHVLELPMSAKSKAQPKNNDEIVSIEEASGQKLFMFDNKKDAQAKAKEIRGKMMELGPKNFAVITKDLTVVREEGELDEMKVRGQEAFDKTFANRTQAENFAKKNGGTVRQVGRVFYVFKEEVDMSNYNYRTEAHSPMHVSKAIRVAEKMGGNMTGAVEKIEKMSKGLSDHPKVKAALRMANEEFDLTEQKKKKDMTPDELEDELFDMSRLMNMAIEDGIWSKSKLINTLATGGFNKAKISKALDMYKKEFDKSPRLMNYEKGVKILKRAKVHEGVELNEKAESQAQAIAARIALKHKREGTKPESGTASAEMMKMSEKDLEDFTKAKKGAPEKVEEAKMSDAEVLSAAKKLASNGKDEKTKKFGQGLVDFHKKNDSFTPDQVAGLQNIMKNASFQMAKEEVELDEAFRKGDKVKIKDSGKTGTIRRVGTGSKRGSYTVDVGNQTMSFEDDELIKESVELNENFRTLARHGMGTEPKSSRTKVGLELDYYDKDGSKRSGKIIKTDAKGYTVKDDRDGKTHSFSFHDRAKAKSLLAKHGKGKYNEEFDLMESHFKVGDKVTCIESGMKGEVIKLDEPQVGKYYTVRREDGKVMKYASDELKKVMSEAMDPVDKDALKKKFKKRKDKDIDNDGDVDSTDKYLHKRRSAISKAIAKEESETKLKEKDVDRDGDEDDIDKSLKQRQQKAIDLD